MNLRQWHTPGAEGKIIPPTYSSIKEAKSAFTSWKDIFTTALEEVKKKKRTGNSDSNQQDNIKIDEFITIANSAVYVLDDLVNNIDKNNKSNIEEYTHYLTHCCLSLLEPHTVISINGQKFQVQNLLKDFNALQIQITNRLSKAQGSALSNLFQVLKEGVPRFILGAGMIAAGIFSGIIPAIIVTGIGGLLFMRSGVKQAGHKYQFFKSPQTICDLKDKIQQNQRLFNKPVIDRHDAYHYSSTTAAKKRKAN